MTGIDPMKESVKERKERYLWSSMDEVSDPEEWMELHHGHVGESASENAESEVIELDENGYEMAHDPVEEVEDAPAVSSTDPFESMAPAECETFKNAENRWLGIHGPLPDAEPDVTEMPDD